MKKATGYSLLATGFKPSRRDFLKVIAVAGGGVVMSISLKGCAQLRNRGARAGDGTDPSVFVRINPDNTTTITVPKSEMGQGVRTSLAMMVAEELDCDWNTVKVETAPYDPKYGDQGTGGSGSTPGSWTRLRTAGATLRSMLVAAAASEWGVPASECVTGNSTITHPSGKSAGFGELAARAATQAVPSGVTLKPRSEWKLIGKDRTGVDVLDITHGRAVYGMDVKVPGMLYAAIARTPIFGGTVKSYDDAETMKVPGVRRAVQVAPIREGINVHAGVAVVAENTWAALEGKRLLKIEWEPGPHAQESSAGYADAMRKAIAAKGQETVFTMGDPDGQLAGSGGQVVSADYEFPYLSHATMEPQNCTASVTADRVEIWSPTQFPNWATDAVAQVLGVKPETIITHVTLMGGGFGRRINPDFTVEAAVVSKAIGAPVKVVWSRSDDLGHDFYRPCSAHRVEAVLATDGTPRAWRHRFSSAAINAANGGPAPKAGWGADESDGSANMFYRVPNRSVEFTLLASGVTRGWWRAVHTTHNTFVIETMIDELAELAGKDALEYRLALIDQVPRNAPGRQEEFGQDPEKLKGCLRLAAEKIEWSRARGAGQGVGIACGWDHQSHAAVAVEVTAAGNTMKINRVVVAADCGPVVNPTGARAQMEGGVTQALSVALHEAITIQGGAVVQANFDTYPLLRMRESPPVIESYFVDSDTHPTGLGEPAVPPTAPALANAIYRAMGGGGPSKRIRSLPMQIQVG